MNFSWVALPVTSKDSKFFGLGSISSKFSVVYCTIYSQREHVCSFSLTPHVTSQPYSANLSTSHFPVCTGQFCIGKKNFPLFHVESCKNSAGTILRFIQVSPDWGVATSFGCFPISDVLRVHSVSPFVKPLKVVELYESNIKPRVLQSLLTTHQISNLVYCTSNLLVQPIFF